MNNFNDLLLLFLEKKKKTTVLLSETTSSATFSNRFNWNWNSSAQIEPNQRLSMVLDAFDGIEVHVE